MTERITDRIIIRDFRLQLYCGALPEEQARTQPFQFDIDVITDLSRPSQTDDLTDTVHYGELIAELESSLMPERFQLLERLAGRVAEIVLGHEQVQKVRVTVQKLRPPVPQHVASTGVRIVRSRG